MNVDNRQAAIIPVIGLNIYWETKYLIFYFVIRG